jgi:hypothetical protein
MHAYIDARYYLVLIITLLSGIIAKYVLLKFLFSKTMSV